MKWKVTDKKGQELEIRPLQPTDALSLYKFFESLSKKSKETFQPHPFTLKFAKKITKDYHSRFHLRFVAIIPKGDDEIVGYAFITRPPLFTQNGYFGIAVSDAFQGRGVGSQLMDTIISYAQTKGTKNIYLNVMQKNHKARKAYLKLGFQPTGIPPLLGKAFTLYELWYNETLSDLWNHNKKKSSKRLHTPIWMVK